MKLKISVVLGSIFWTQFLYAQEFRSESNPPPVIKSFDFQLGGVTPTIDLDSYSTRVANAFSLRFVELKQPLQEGEISCSSPKLASYALALKTQGEYAKCTKLVTDCGNQAVIDLVALTYGASCADRTNQIELAYNLLERATAESLPLTPERKWATLRFALLMINTEFPDRVPGLLSRIPEWRGEMGNRIENVLHALNLSRKGQIPEADLKSTIDSLSLASPLIESDLAVGWMLYLVYGKYAMADAIQYISDRLGRLIEPDRVFRTTFVAFYHQPAPNYLKANKILSAVYPHAFPQMQFPIEENIYNRTDLYRSACASGLSSGKAQRELRLLSARFQDGAPAEQLLREMGAWPESVRGLADVLTFEGALLSSLAQEDSALGLFWKAHLVCPYYHRSHAGMSHIIKSKRVRAYRDYEQIHRRVELEKSKLENPKKIAEFIVNYKSLSPDEALGAMYSIRYWLPFVDALVQTGLRLYMKSFYQYHGEIRGFEEFLDLRVPTPDNRLYDELRGTGGDQVVSDLGETLRTPFGDYNLGAHELAHGWHINFLKGRGRTDLSQCISKLYEAAKERDLFADPYAGSNVYEYFAQGVTYYQIPADAPARYGINQLWIIKNDPELFRFLEIIDRSHGDLNSVSCPTSSKRAKPSFRAQLGATR